MYVEVNFFFWYYLMWRRIGVTTTSCTSVFFLGRWWCFGRSVFRSAQQMQLGRDGRGGSTMNALAAQQISNRRNGRSWPRWPWRIAAGHDGRAGSRMDAAAAQQVSNVSSPAGYVKSLEGLQRRFLFLFLFFWVHCWFDRAWSRGFVRVGL